MKPSLSALINGLIAMACSLPAKADLPLTVENLITDKGKVKADISLSYANVQRQGLVAGEPVTVQTGPTSFVDLPVFIGESQVNSDSAVLTLGLRYGLSAKTEVYARWRGLANRQRTSAFGLTQTSTRSAFADAWAGVNVQIKSDDESPALLGFVEVALREKREHCSASFKSAMVGLTTYKAIDPVVFSLTGAYRWNQRRKDCASDHKPGNLLLLNPSVAFAVNDRVTLTTSVQWTRRQPDSREGKPQVMVHTATDLLLGAGYAFAKGNTLSTTFKLNASGNNGAELRMNWLYTF